MRIMRWIVTKKRRFERVSSSVVLGMIGSELVIYVHVHVGVWWLLGREGGR